MCVSMRMVPDNTKTVSDDDDNDNDNFDARRDNRIDSTTKVLLWIIR